MRRGLPTPDLKHEKSKLTQPILHVISDILWIYPRTITLQLYNTTKLFLNKYLDLLFDRRLTCGSHLNANLESSISIDIFSDYSTKLY